MRVKIKPNALFLFDNSSVVDIFELIGNEFQEQLAISANNLENLY